MKSISIYLIGITCTAGLGFLILFCFQPMLRKIYLDLCGKEDRADFWTALSNMFLVLLPLTAAMFNQPNGGLVFYDVLSQVRWSLVGVGGTLLAIGVVVFTAYAHRKVFR